MGHPERNTTTAVSAGDHSMKGHLALLLANTMFGFNVPIAKGVLASGMVSPYALNLFRMGGAALLFWIASLFAPREKVSRKDLVLLFFASLFSIQLNQTSFLIGLSMTSPIDASIAASTVPILTMLIAAVYLKEPITWKKAIGVAVGASGALLLILSNGTVDTAGRSGSIAGDMICLMGALSFAIYLAVFKRLIARYSSVTMMKWMFLYAAICAIPLCGGDAAAIDYAHLSPALWGGVLYVVCCATFFSYLLIPVGQKYLRPTVVGMYTYLQPFIASVVAVLAGLDRFGFAKGIAAVMVCLGVYIVNQSKSRAQLDAERAARQQAASAAQTSPRA